MIETIEDLVRIALDVTGMSRARWDFLAEAMKSDAEMNRIMRDDWHAKPRSDERSIRGYYRESDIWFVNTFNHGAGSLLALASGQRPLLAAWQETFLLDFHTNGKILDYGGGLLKDTWPFVAEGRRVTLAEVRGPVTRLLSTFVKVVGLEGRVEVLEVDEDFPLVETYRGAVSFETLEHLYSPVEFAKHLYEHLAPLSPFAFSASFGDTPHAPYHVARNASLGNGQEWAGKLSEIGFRPHRWSGEGQHLQIWRRG